MWWIIYLGGAVASQLFYVWFEYRFDHDRNLRNVTRKEWIQDLLLSLTSWVGVLLGLFAVWYVVFKRDKWAAEAAAKAKAAAEAEAAKSRQNVSKL